MVESASTIYRRITAKRTRKYKPDAEIVLICNPKAGGRWKALAGILDSEEASFARRIVTDSVEDIASAFAELEHDAKLICIYGGDGTVQRVLDRLAPDENHQASIAILGGGTMNVTSRWCGFSSNPAHNFRHVVNAYLKGELLLREVPILEVETGSQLHRGFTFGMGPIVRLLDAYEQGKKGKLAAIKMGARAIAAVWTRFPSSFKPLLEEMEAVVELDDERLPDDRFSALFANVTGQINPGVAPFATERTRESFHCAAYAVNAREITLALPLLVRGLLPVDLWRTIKPDDEGLKIETDPRFVNRPACKLDVRTSETIYTVDGEILPVADGAVSVRLGPHLKLAVGTKA